LLWAHELPLPASVNAGIGLEILLKSFSSEVDGSPGGTGEQYRFVKQSGQNGHNLLSLFDAIPEDLRAQLCFDQHRSWIHDYFQEPFVRARYPYERDADGSYSSVITEIAEAMFESVIAAYKQQGCSDPWIEAYPNV
jgi:hypothetical protein